MLYYSNQDDMTTSCKRARRRGLGHYDGREACAAEGWLARARGPSCFLVHGGFRSRPCGLPRFLGHGVGLGPYMHLLYTQNAVELKLVGDGIYMRTGG